MKRISIRTTVCSLVCFLFLIHSTRVSAQGGRTQYPGFLTNHTYFEINVGYINYAFSNAHLTAGHSAGSVYVPHAAVRLVLYGYQFNKFLSAQISYMRPVLWIQYKNVDGDHDAHSVTMNITGVTLKSFLLNRKKLSLYIEAGGGHVTRTGFDINNSVVLKDLSYITFLGGAGLNYSLNDKWSLIGSTAWSPASSKQGQPATVFAAAGIRYNVHRLSAATVEENKNSPYFRFPNLLQVGYTSNVLGYGVNNVASNKVFPVFWGGDVQVGKGYSIYYQRNFFHGRKLFSIDLGASISYWKSNVQNTGFYTLSLFPVFRFSFLHLKTTDLYFNYSVAGPSYISKVKIDDTPTGKHFTFQDLMGIGIFTGKHRNLNAEIRIAHYSNGDLFPENNGVKVPLSLNVGYAF
ncbi:MAG: acyloxyacyl hydrolase [Bacteroidota bacterium]|nr:acyloxyacyl hydrolase [Bacteroidota bacterium]